MRRIVGIVGILFMIGGLSVHVWAGFQRPFSTEATVNGRFIGAWRLVSLQADGKPDANRGVHPTGLICYDAMGHMAAQIAPDRSRPSWPSNSLPTPDQAKEAVTGYTAYFGTYTVNEGARTVTHHREGALNMYAVDVVRKYEFTVDGRLILTPVENPSNRLTWERIR